MKGYLRHQVIIINFNPNSNYIAGIFYVDDSPLKAVDTAGLAPYPVDMIANVSLQLNAEMEIS